MSRLTRDETAEPVSRDQIHRRGRGQGNIYFPCPADDEQDEQPYPVILTLAVCMTIRTYIYIRTYIPVPGIILLPGNYYWHKKMHCIDNITYFPSKLLAVRFAPVAQRETCNLLTRWDVSSIPANGIFLTKKLKTKTKNAQRVEND